MTVLLYVLLGILTVAAMLALTVLLGPRRYQKSKFTPYECGVPQLQGSRGRLPVKYYLVAILFVLFDIEVVFMFPWAVIYRELGVYGLIEMVVFVLILGFGLLYAWMRGALRWD